MSTIFDDIICDNRDPFKAVISRRALSAKTVQPRTSSMVQQIS